MLETYQIKINGQVQGVGFRPFVFNLAQKHQLRGEVYNDQEGVKILIQSTEESTRSFLEEIIQNIPPSAIITDSSFEKVDRQDFDSFKIIPSKSNSANNLPVTSDFAICKNCVEEMGDPKNRRFNYPFITCVNCGPRYSIIQKFPFDRNHTSIADMEMCEECRAEYISPENKRFHSQTNSCARCGFQLELSPSDANISDTDALKILEQAAENIKKGKIVGIKNTSGYLICCSATQGNVIKELRKRKKRARKPFAVMYPDLQRLKKDFEISTQEEDELTSPQRPIVIIPYPEKATHLAFEQICPGLHQIGLMLPNSGIFQMLMNQVQSPIIATSANIHGSPIVFDKADAEKQLSGVVDIFVHHNLPIEFPQDDSVLKILSPINEKIMLRRSRAYAPNCAYIKSVGKEKILAMGAQQKSNFLFTPNQFVNISQYIGDLDNFDVFERYRFFIEKYFQMFRSQPDVIVVDKNLVYQSHILGKELALRFDCPCVEVQHHKAHFASVIGEQEKNGELPERILGVVWDGTGLGDDGNIWGGEFFIYEERQITRKEHFEHFHWILNNKMAIETKIPLLSILHRQNPEFVKSKFSKTELSLYQKKLSSNHLQTTSMGRLIDAVASLLGVCDYNTHEGEAAMLLENLALSYTQRHPIKAYSVLKNDCVFSPKMMLQAIFEDMETGTPKHKIACRFFYTLADIIFAVAEYHQIKHIYVSGGVFQNSLILEFLYQKSKKMGLVIKKNSILPSNDENISFGQYVSYVNGF